MSRVGPYRLWALAFVAYFLMIASWALAAPYDATADEHEHLYRAAGVAAGEVAPEPANAVRGGGAYQTVPRGLVRDQHMCWQWRQTVSASCAIPPDGDRTPVRVGSGAGRYHPAYYAAVGLPLKWWPGWTGVYLARLIGGALGAALLAGAVVAIFRYTRRRYMMAGLLVAVTPTALHFLAAVNPNGLEIAAGVGFFAAAIPLALGNLDRTPRGLVALAGLSAAALAVLRPTGLLLLAVAAVALLVPPHRAALGRLWRSVVARWWAAALGVTIASAVVWTIAMRSTEFGPYYQPVKRYTPGQAAAEVTQRWGDWVEQMIAIFNWLENRPPQTVYLIWEFAVGALLLCAVMFGRSVDRWRLFAVFAGGALVPSALQVRYVNENGFITQGRYLLPLLVGLVLLAGYVVDERGLPAAPGRALVRLFVLLLLPVQLFCLLFAMARWQRGLPDYGDLGPSSLNPFVGDWHPPVGSATPLVALGLGAALLGWLAWQSTPRIGDADAVVHAVQVEPTAVQVEPTAVQVEPTTTRIPKPRGEDAGNAGDVGVLPPPAMDAVRVHPDPGGDGHLV